MISKEILEKYAEVMVKFAVGRGKGIKKGDNVQIVYDMSATPLGREIYKQVIKAGGNPFNKIVDDQISKIFYENSSDEQLEFFPENYYHAMADTFDHSIRVFATDDVFYLKDIDPEKMMVNAKSMKPYKKWIEEKEDKGKYSWTLCLYATEASAKEAGLTVDEYWEQIVKACFLNEEDPIRKWKNVISEQERIIKELDSMPIDRIHVKSESTDLWITLGENRRWIGGDGCNIPSFEIFTSPDWRGTNGYISFEQPLYRFGNVIKGIKLEFVNGKIVKAKADQNENLLLEMIKQDNADKIGEFSLTDKRFSKIDKFMAETLYDENFGGEYGNCHIAVGNSYHETYKGDKGISEEKYNELGFNDSVEHTDIVTTSNREVTVVLKDGSDRVIYKDGIFLI